MSKERNKKNNLITTGLIAENRKARFNYEITDKIEAGIELLGSEVKALRLGKANITDAWAAPKDNEFFIENMEIGLYQAQRQDFAHPLKRKRKLLLNKREIAKLIGIFNTANMSIIPLKLYFNEKGKAKLLLGIGKGKTQSDKRETIKKRDWERSKKKIMSK